ncbi:MAG: hypothetical protein J1F02_04485 [Lachnospiraceae bacterium]|nr:hypothetical protein [Lachnospiraceae bacterium]
MQIHTPIIESTVMASISQMIVPEEMYQTGWIYNFFCNVTMDKKAGVFSFEDYRMFWEYGILLKRYFEYPWREYTTMQQIYDFLTGYLDKKYYVVNYLENFTFRGEAFKPYLLLYDYDKEGHIIKFCCWNDKDKVRYYQTEFAEYYDKILMPQKSEANLRFDMLFMRGEFEKQWDLEIIKGNFERAEISNWKAGFFINRMNEEQQKHSLCVLQEWRDVFLERLAFMKRKGMLKNDEIIKKVLELKGKQENSSNLKRNLKDMIRTYNHLCLWFITSIKS